MIGIYYHKEISMSKLLTREQKKQAVLAEMLTGSNLTDVATRYKVDAVTIRSWVRKEDERALADEVIDLDPVILRAVTKEIKDKAANSPTMTTQQLNRLDEGLANIKDGVDGLKLLENNFHDTILKMLTWANSRITDDMKISEWKTIVDGIVSLHSTLFGKGSSTQINLMQQNNNNNASSAKVEKFKGGFRT
jgi:transposase-like protein